MTSKRYLIIELVMVCILGILCFSIYEKRTGTVADKGVWKEAKASEADKGVWNEAAGANTEESRQKVCYLTFDDGPSKNSEKILDILDEYEAKATFFLIGEELSEEKKPILKRMVESGHAIGLHSNVHDFNELYGSVDICVQDFEAEYVTLKEEYGIDTKLFRFPGGSACRYMGGQRKQFVAAMQEKGYRCYDWNVSGEDSYGNPTAWSVQENVFSNFFDYSKPIILLHDANGAGATVEALPGILEKIKAEGYTFGTLENEEEYVYR